jgi:uncharacterized UBP type Zn finger protein
MLMRAGIQHSPWLNMEMKGHFSDRCPRDFRRSGVTDRMPFVPEGASDMSTLEAKIEANAVAPHRFKALVGKGHSEFSTSNQQDACEFFIHLMQLLERSERVAGDRIKPSEEAPPLSSIFKFKVEQRTQCAVTGAVSYRHEEQNVLHVDIPLEAATNSQVCSVHMFPATIQYIA